MQADQVDHARTSSISRDSRLFATPCPGSPGSWDPGAGVTGMAAIAQVLNHRGIRTARGGRWLSRQSPTCWLGPGTGIIGMASSQGAERPWRPYRPRRTLACVKGGELACEDEASISSLSFVRREKRKPRASCDAAPLRGLSRKRASPMTDTAGSSIIGNGRPPRLLGSTGSRLQPARRAWTAWSSKRSSMTSSESSPRDSVIRRPV